jgi:hypothetical protein
LTFNVATFSGFYHAAKDYMQIIITAFALTIPLFTILERSNNEIEIVLIGVVYFIIHFITANASRNTNRIGSLFKSTGKYLNMLLLMGTAIGSIAGILYNLKYFSISLVFFVLIFVVENLRKPAGIATIAGHFDDRILASVLSIESQLSSIIGAIMSIVIGLIADKLGPGFALSIMASILLVFYPVLRILKPN